MPRQYRGGKGPPPALTEKEIDVLVDERKRGRTYAQIVKDLKAAGRPLTESTIKKYMHRREKERREREDEDEPADDAAELKLRRRKKPTVEGDEPAPTLIDVSDVPSMLRRQLQQAQANAEKAERDDEPMLAAKYSKLAVEYANQLQRAERAASVNRNVLQFQRSEIDDAMARVRERVRATLSRGACRCPACAQDLSADLAGMPRPSSEAAE
jgi:hypothetical protein